VTDVLRAFTTLLYKELLRFWKVAAQTISAPILTALLYLLVFGHAFDVRIQVYPGVSYTAFLIPGLVMMSILQNAFANTSSSLIQSKINGSIVFLLLAQLYYVEWFGAYLLAAVTRGIVVGAGVFLVTLWFADLPFFSPLWIMVFSLFSAAVLGAMGLIAGIWADKYDQLASFQNFLITPATFLSGVFYSIYALPPFWQEISRLNPFFYMVDGLRYGFLGHSDVNPWFSFAVVAFFFGFLSLLSLHILRIGYKLRH
jgi:ABC-2 type transport system permease protein